MGFPLMPTEEPMQVDASPPFELEALREMGFLEGHEVAGPDSLSPSFLKDGGELLTRVSKTPGTNVGRRDWYGLV